MKPEEIEVGKYYTVQFVRGERAGQIIRNAAVGPEKDDVYVFRCVENGKTFEQHVGSGEVLRRTANPNISAEQLLLSIAYGVSLADHTGDVMNDLQWAFEVMGMEEPPLNSDATGYSLDALEKMGAKCIIQLAKEKDAASKD